MKSQQTAGQEEEEEAQEDEYGGSTDEEPEEVQLTPVSTLPSLGKISVKPPTLSLLPSLSGFYLKHTPSDPH